MNELLKDTLPKLGLVKTVLQQHSNEKLLAKKKLSLRKSAPPPMENNPTRNYPFEN